MKDAVVSKVIHGGSVKPAHFHERDSSKYYICNDQGGLSVKEEVKCSVDERKNISAAVVLEIHMCLVETWCVWEQTLRPEGRSIWSLEAIRTALD